MSINRPEPTQTPFETEGVSRRTALRRIGKLVVAPFAASLAVACRTEPYTIEKAQMDAEARLEKTLGRLVNPASVKYPNYHPLLNALRTRPEQPSDETFYELSSFKMAFTDSLNLRSLGTFLYTKSRSPNSSQESWYATPRGGDVSTLQETFWLSERIENGKRIRTIYLVPNPSLGLQTVEIPWEGLVDAATAKKQQAGLFDFIHPTVEWSKLVAQSPDIRRLDYLEPEPTFQIKKAFERFMQASSVLGDSIQAELVYYSPKMEGHVNLGHYPEPYHFILLKYPLPSTLPRWGLQGTAERYFEKLAPQAIIRAVDLARETGNQVITPNMIEAALRRPWNTKVTTSEVIRVRDFRDGPNKLTGESLVGFAVGDSSGRRIILTNGYSEFSGVTANTCLLFADRDIDVSLREIPAFTPSR